MQALWRRCTASRCGGIPQRPMMMHTLPSPWSALRQLTVGGESGSMRLHVTPGRGLSSTATLRRRGEPVIASYLAASARQWERARPRGADMVGRQGGRCAHAHAQQVQVTGDLVLEGQRGAALDERGHLMRCCCRVAGLS